MANVIIKTDNAAFSDLPRHECARILRAIADKLEHGTTRGNCIDIDGSTCGVVRLGNA
jgi:hypothetical protein